MIRFEPQYSRIMIARDAFQEPSKLIVTPDSAKSKPCTGKIVAAGPDCSKFKVGDRVLFSKIAGFQVGVIDYTHPRANKTTGEVEWLVIDESEVLALVYEEGAETVVTGSHQYVGN